MNIRVGQGYDVHQLVEGRDLILGGVNIPFEKAYWAIPMPMRFCMRLPMPCWARPVWAISAAIFPILPPNLKMQTAVCCCARLIKACRHWVGRWLMSIRRDCAKPKLAPHISAMRANIAADLGLPENCVNIKGKTNEKTWLSGAYGSH